MAEKLTVHYDVLSCEGPCEPGELRVFRNSHFSPLTMGLVVAEFVTADGRLSEVHRKLRGQEYFVVGEHGDNEQKDVYHPTAEKAVEDALNRQDIARVTR